MPPQRPPQGQRQAPIRPSGPQSAIPSHVQTIGVRRPGTGVGGRKIVVMTNHFKCKIPENIIHHYDVVIGSHADKTLPARLNMEIINRLQTEVAPEIFTPRVVYDGRKNIFSPRQLPFDHVAEFPVPVYTNANVNADKPPKNFRVKLTKVAEINPEVLQRYLEGKQSHENVVLTAITALNVVIRMEPSCKYPFNIRSFFTDRGHRDIGAGITVWRGYFQSVRPAVGRMLINVDISTATMYKAGPLGPLLLEVLADRDIQPQNLYFDVVGERERMKLQRFLGGARVIVATDPNKSPRIVKKVLGTSPQNTQFRTREGQVLTVAAYYKATYNKSLAHPKMICVEVGAGAVIPVELCTVPPGQILKKNVPPAQTKLVLEFATRKPFERLKDITDGLKVLQYGQSDYLRHFSMTVDENALRCNARVLQPPVLQYGRGSRQVTIQPRDGAWNMVDKKFYRCSNIRSWIIVIYERRNRFNETHVQSMISGLRQATRDTGMGGFDSEPLVRWESGQGSVENALKAMGGEVRQKTGSLPTIVFAVLPEGATDIYQAIKHFGDCTTGVPTQCLKSSKCHNAKQQYWANICLKINVKLGGVNTVPEPRSVPFLSDPANPTLVLGADVIHPAPGSEGRPSFTSVVGNVDSDSSKYVATTRVQTSRQEMIDDLEEMVAHIIGMYQRWRINVEKIAESSSKPKRIIFFRDGVSEGQFKTVIDDELPRLKAACAKAGLNPLPPVTVVVVGKRHHVRLFPTSKQDEDRSGNCPSGTVVDVDIVHPTEFDFYLQSHAGLLGTSRPAHYSVLYDENRFTADALQQLAFALCHVYARSTRAVSIPAPVYYADIVCARARNHYAPGADVDFTTDDQTGGDHSRHSTALKKYKDNFKPLHTNAQQLMYFS